MPIKRTPSPVDRIYRKPETDAQVQHLDSPCKECGGANVFFEEYSYFERIGDQEVRKIATRYHCVECGSHMRRSVDDNPRDQKDRIHDRIQRAVLKRDTNRCQVCGGTERPPNLAHTVDISRQFSSLQISNYTMFFYLAITVFVWVGPWSIEHIGVIAQTIWYLLTALVFASIWRGNEPIR